MNPQLFLIDGALSQQPRPRAAVIEQMAGDLIRLDAHGNEADAIRCLIYCERYSTFEVMTYVDRARYQAQQQIVAQMMSDRPGVTLKERS